MTDPIDEAIAKTPETQQLIGGAITIGSTGRTCQVGVPMGMTVQEMAELTAWMWTQLLPQAQQAGTGQRPGLVIDTPRGPVALKRN